MLFCPRIHMCKQTHDIRQRNQKSLIKMHGFMNIESVNYKKMNPHDPRLFLSTRMPMLCVRLREIIIKIYGAPWPEKILGSFLQYFIYFFETLYFCRTIFDFMILVNFSKYFLSWYLPGRYLFAFSNTCFILNTSYFFEILPITFRYFLTFWNTC